MLRARTHQPNVTMEAFYAMVRTEVQPISLQRVDGGFHRRMPLPEANKFRIRLPLPIDGRQTAFLGKNHPVDVALEFGLIRRTVETLVVAHAGEALKALIGFLGHGDSDLFVGGFLHHLVVQNESMLVLEHTDLEP